MGAFTQSGSAGSAASLADGANTFTANEFGSYGNSISIALIDPAAPSVPLSISVVGNAIEVTLETDGASAIITDESALTTAMMADSNVTALISVTGAGATVKSALPPTTLAGGADTVFTNNAPISTISLSQIGTGKYRISLADYFPNLLHANIQIQKAVAADAVAQVESVDIAFGGDKEIIFNVLAGASPVNLLSTDVVYINLDLRNSANPN